MINEFDKIDLGNQSILYKSYFICQLLNLLKIVFKVIQILF